MKPEAEEQRFGNKRKVLCESVIEQVHDPRDEVEGNIRTLGNLKQN